MTIGSRKIVPPRMLADRAVGRLPHALEAEFLDACLVGGDRGAFDADMFALDGLRRVDGHLVVGGVDGSTMPRSEVFQVDVVIRQDQTVLDILPDHAGHFVAVEFVACDLACDLDLGHWFLLIRCVAMVPVISQAGDARRVCHDVDTESHLSISLEGMSQEIEIGLGQEGGRLAIRLDDISIVPSRRTRDSGDVSTAWQVMPTSSMFPVIAAPMDSVTSPATAITMGKLGGLGVLESRRPVDQVRGIRSRFRRIAHCPLDEATSAIQSRIRRADQARADHQCVCMRSRDCRCHGRRRLVVPSARSSSYSTVVDAGVDLFVIRGTVVSAEHVSNTHEPLNLKRFIYDLDVPVIVGVRPTIRRPCT